jgi:hypothetical protein
MMTVQELILNFPEIPRDLHDEPLLAQYAETFGHMLQEAVNPGACSADYTPGNRYYLKLIGHMRLYMYGLSTKDKVLAKLQELLDQYQADPDGFTEELLTAESVL